MPKFNITATYILVYENIEADDEDSAVENLMENLSMSDIVQDFDYEVEKQDNL